MKNTTLRFSQFFRSLIQSIIFSVVTENTTSDKSEINKNVICAISFTQNPKCNSMSSKSIFKFMDLHSVDL